MNKNRGSIGLILLIIAAVLATLFVFIVAIFVVIYLFVAQPNQIKGRAMSPEYKENEYILTSKISYRSALPERGDVVIYRSPKTVDLDFVSRVIGLPGEKIKIYQGKVYVNDQLLNESAYPVSKDGTYAENFLAEGTDFTIPSNSYFVMGDNRPHASDSRDFGPVPKESIIGKVVGCYWNCQR